MDQSQMGFAPITSGDTYEESAQKYLPQQAPETTPSNGRITFSVYHPTTQSEGEVDEHELMNQLRQAGYTPLSATADGLTLTLQGQDGNPFEVDTKDVIGKMGWEVKDQKPTNANYDHIDTGLRALIESPGIKHDDETKKDLIKSRLQRQGLDNPQVIGSGSDFYAFDPHTSQWYALTNKPGMDLSDLGEAAARAPGIIGAGIGMAAGAGAGPLGMAGGSAMGGFMGNRATDAVASLLSAGKEGELDNDYTSALHKTGGMQRAEDMFGDAGEDALAGLAGAGVSKLGSLGAGALKGGVVSKLARGLGGLTEGVGKTVGDVGEWAGQGLPREIGSTMFDPTGLSFPAQAAKDVLHGGTRLAGHIGDSEFMEALSPNLAQKMRDFAARGLTRQPSKIGTQMGTEELLSNLSSNPMAGSTGRVIDAAGKLGALPYDTITGAMKHGGRAAEMLGAIPNKLGKAVGAYEVPGALNYGAEEYYNNERARRRALQQRALQSTIEPEKYQLANYP